MKIVKLIFVRHAQTVQNKNHIYQGQSIGGTISAQGKKEIEKVAEKLKGEKIDVLYSSPLNRAKKTAEGIHKHHREAKLIYLDEFMETSGGELEGQSTDIYLGQREKFKGNFFDFKPKEGESLKECYQRASKKLKEIILNSPEKTIAIVSHNALLRLVGFFLLNKPLHEETFLDSYHVTKNTTVSTFLLEVTDGKFKVLKYSLNDSSHL